MSEHLIENARVLRATEKAIRVTAPGLAGPTWIPLSVVLEDSEVFQPGDEGDLLVAEWWAGKYLEDVEDVGDDGPSPVAAPLVSFPVALSDALTAAVIPPPAPILPPMADAAPKAPTRCILCRRDLPDPESAAIGIGPVCLQRTGVAAAEIPEGLRAKLRALAMASPGRPSQSAFAPLTAEVDPVAVKLRASIMASRFDVRPKGATGALLPGSGSSTSNPVPPDFLTDGQKKAFRLVHELPPEGRLAIVGFAGTGKTFQLKAVAESLPGGIQGAVVLAPTGKAALRVKEATGIPTALTIHRWCYRPEENPKTGGIVFNRVAPVMLPSSKTLFVDEGSMIGRELHKDLEWAVRQAKCKLVVLGDGFQLPPVESAGSLPFSLMKDGGLPEAKYTYLTEVKRQAGDSPVLAASMKIREGDVQGALKLLPNVKSSIAFHAALRVRELGGVIVVHRNQTRTALNRKMRAALGFPEGDLTVGEPILVTRNNYSVNLYNGEIVPFRGWAIPPGEPSIVSDYYSKKDAPIRFALGRFGDAAEPALAVVAIEDIEGRIPKEIGEKALSFGAHEWAERNCADRFEEVEVYSAAAGEYVSRAVPPAFLRCNHGYAMTCHKMQGSQAPIVLTILEPTIKLNTEEGRRWAYTSITRAEKQAPVASVPWGWP